MKVYGIVCECNPFHRGHQKIIQTAREYGADAVIGVMSGDFVQRGEPAITSKFGRAEQMARHGFDLVIELPARFVLSSAQRFSAGAVKILNDIGVVDTLLFGSECGSVQRMEDVVQLLLSKEIEDRIKDRQEEGESYPVARENVVREELGDDYVSVLQGGNNLLGIEYLRTVRMTDSNLKVKTFRREEDGLTAHLARELLKKGEDVSGILPEDSDFSCSYENPIDERIFERAVLMRLREMKEQDFASLEDISGGLDMRLYKASRSAASLEELYGNVKTKRYTMSRIKRTTLRAALQLKGSSDMDPPYARVLAIGEKGTDVLGEMKKEAKIPFGDSLKSLAQTSPFADAFAEEERRATDFYNLNRVRPLPVGEDFTHRLFVLK